jgi:hypothetical protein
MGLHQSTRDRFIDLNGLLMGVNVLIMGLIAYGSSELWSNPYLDQKTIALGLILCLQTHLALWLERKRRDPFVLLLAFWTIFYYSFRIFTLSVLPFSSVFGRYPFDADDSNYALLYIIVANVFLYGGFLLTWPKYAQTIVADQWRAVSGGRVVILLLGGIAMTYLSGDYWTEGNVPRALNFLVLYFAPSVLVTMALAYYFLFRGSLSPRFALSIAILIVIEIAAHTLLGSRSGIVGFVQTYMLALVGVAGCIKLRRKVVIWGIALLPAVIAILVASFAISSYIRATRLHGDTVDLSGGVALATESQSQLSMIPNPEALLGAVASRAGGFDFSAEIIAHRDIYASVINFPSYGRSIVDNILTPGFDVYDQPKIANALQFVYMDWGQPSKEAVSEFYQSDQLGIYGEFYTLFGYGSLPLLFLLAYLLKRTYTGVRSPNPFIWAMKRIIVLFVFVRLIDSFGFDWIILDTLPLVAALYIYRFFFACEPVAPGKSEPPLRVLAA